MNITRTLETNKFIYNLTTQKKNATDNRSTNNRYIQRVLQPLVGDFKVSANNSDFNGWLICDGRSLERAAFPELFAIIGTVYGSDGNGYFNLPDCRGRALCAIGQGSGLTNRVIGTITGTETHTLIIDEMPTHNHAITDPGHVHTGDTYRTGNQSTDNAFGTQTAADEGVATDSVDRAYTEITIQDKGGSQPHNNMQPSIFLGNVFIYSGITPVEYVILDYIREWVESTQYNRLYESFFNNVYKYIYDSIENGIENLSIGVRYMISDGGGDMFDGGNMISISGDAFNGSLIPTRQYGDMNIIPYGTIYENPNKTSGIYISSKNSYPHLVFTFAQSGTITIQCSGNEGSDNYGLVTNIDADYASDNGKTGHYWANINYNAGDPTICEVWFTVCNTNDSAWNTSEITDVIDNRKQEDNNGYDHSVTVTGTHYFFCHILLSKEDGITFTEDELTRFIKEYVETIPVQAGFIAPEQNNED